MLMKLFRLCSGTQMPTSPPAMPGALTLANHTGELLLFPRPVTERHLVSLILSLQPNTPFSQLAAQGLARISSRAGSKKGGDFFLQPVEEQNFINITQALHLLFFMLPPNFSRSTYAKIDDVETNMSDDKLF